MEKAVDIKMAKPITVKLDKMPEIMKKKNQKIRVLWYSDFLRRTGFGNVAEEILSRLHKTGKYEFVVLGINYHGQPYCQPDSDYYHLKDIPVYPAFSGGANSSLFGYDILDRMLRTQQFDIFFTLQDSFNLLPMADTIIDAKQNKEFSYIFYFPIDGDIKKEWVDKAIKLADYPVTYTEYGRKKVVEQNSFVEPRVIPHGVDLEKFKPFNTEKDRHDFRKKYFGIEKDLFLITNVNRNQPRKDLPRTILAFSEFCKKYKNINTKLYLHCYSKDNAGHKLHEYTKNYLPEDLWDRIIMPADDLMEGNGVSTDILSKIYASSDLVTSTTYGEGWGLSTTEAMSCKTPVVMPDNSATTEIIGAGNERGYLVKCGQNLNMMFVQKFDNELMRPLTDINDLIKQWKHVHDNKQEAKKKAEKAYSWLQNYTWDIIAEKWDKLFMEAYANK